MGVVSTYPQRFAAWLGVNVTVAQGKEAHLDLARNSEAATNGVWNGMR